MKKLNAFFDKIQRQGRQTASREELRKAVPEAELKAALKQGLVKTGVTGFFWRVEAPDPGFMKVIQRAMGDKENDDG